VTARAGPRTIRSPYLKLFVVPAQAAGDSQTLNNHWELFNSDSSLATPEFFQLRLPIRRTLQIVLGYNLLCLGPREPAVLANGSLALKQDSC
jgi:hypothetical protein